MKMDSLQVVVKQSRDTAGGKSNLSSLMSLLKDRLFTRSVSHLEELVVVISVAAQSIPSQDVNQQEKSRISRSIRSRSLLVSRARWEILQTSFTVSAKKKRNIIIYCI